MISTLLTIAWTILFPQRIALVGDTQTNYHVARWIVRDIRGQNIDRAVHVGDYAGCRSYRKWAYIRSILQGFFPWHHTIGNHEIMTCGGRLAKGTGHIWAKYWKTKLFYRHSHGLWHFIHLDTSWSVISTKQLKWLEKQFVSPGYYLVFMHRPPPHPRRNRVYMDPMPYGSRNIKFWKVLLRNRAKIKAIFHGHTHMFKKYNLSGIQVYCTGGGGGYLQSRRERYHYLVVSLWFWGGLTIERRMK